VDHAASREAALFGAIDWRLKMFKIKRACTETISDRLIERFAHMPPLDRERDLKSLRVDRLRERLLGGLILPFTWMSVWVDGVEYRLNGQHSSAVLLEMNGTRPRMLVAHVTEFEASDMEEAAEIWSQIDAVWNARSASDIYRMTGATTPQLCELSSKMLSICAAGITLDHFGNSSNSTAHDKAELLKAHSQFAVEYAMLTMDSVKSRHLRRSPVCAGMSRCYRKCAKDTLIFFSSVRDEDDTNPGVPSRELSRKLREFSVNTGMGAGHGKRIASPMDMATWCIRAFNAFRRGDQSVMLKGLIGGQTSLPAAE